MVFDRDWVCRLFITSFSPLTHTILSFEVSTGMNEEGGFQYNLPMLKFLFGSGRIMALWMSALFLAVALRLITEKYHHHLIFPICESCIPYNSLTLSENLYSFHTSDFLAIPLVFYIVVATGHFDLSHLRETGWLFDVGDADEPWWQFYTYWGAWRSIAYLRFLKTDHT
jgi:SulP family sulfate permease